jgi:hypothetical protein
LLYFTGKEELVTVDQASVIIGAGKLGTALANLGLGDDVILRRGDTIPSEIENNKGEKLSSFPIYVAVSFATTLVSMCLHVYFVCLQHSRVGFTSWIEARRIAYMSHTMLASLTADCRCCCCLALSRLTLLNYNYFCCYSLQVKEDDLEEVLKACPDDKRADLVLLQEGCTEPLLKQYGVCRKDQV